jgi:hypothetical protein
MIRKRKGDKENPWHRPLEDLKICEGALFIKTAKEALLRQTIIQFIDLSFMPS